jgi:hypothetical protein
MLREEVKAQPTKDSMATITITMEVVAVEARTTMEVATRTHRALGCFKNLSSKLAD